MAESTSPSTYDMPVMVGAGVVGLIAIGLFFYMAREPIAPPKAVAPTTAPLNAAAAPVAMIDTSGAGSAAAGQGGPSPVGGPSPMGGPSPVGGGPTPAGGKMGTAN